MATANPALPERNNWNSIQFGKIQEEVYNLTGAHSRLELKRWLEAKEASLPHTGALTRSDEEIELLYIRSLMAQWKRYQVYNRFSRGVPQENAPETLWYQLSEEELDAVQEALDSIEKWRGDAILALTNCVSKILAGKRYKKTKCIVCGRTLSNGTVLQMCAECRQTIIRTRHSRIAEEQALYEKNLLPENLDWVYVSEETKRKILLLLRPGEVLLRDDRLAIYELLQRERRADEKTTGLIPCGCLVCGSTNRSDSHGMCYPCRKYLTEHGCTIAMPRVNKSGGPRAFSRRPKKVAPRTHDLSLIKVR